MHTGRILIPALLTAAAALSAQQSASSAYNVLFLGDSLTEGVPHVGGEVDTYPFMVSQGLPPGSTYVKLGYRGQPTDYLLTHLDSFLFGLLKTDYAKNILVLWAGTNDCALEVVQCVQPVVVRLGLIAKAAHAAGWKVVAVTMIPRSSWFGGPDFQAAFAANAAAVNAQLLRSSDFDGVADPSRCVTPDQYWDGTHLVPAGYRAVANEVLAAIQSLP